MPREYRDRNPDLALIGVEDGFPELSRVIETGWPAAFRATLRPGSPLLEATGTAWAMSAPGGCVMVFSMDGAAVDLDRPLAGGATVDWIGQGSVRVTTTLPPGAMHLTPPAPLANEPWTVALAPAINRRAPGCRP